MKSKDRVMASDNLLFRKRNGLLQCLLTLAFLTCIKGPVLADNEGVIHRSDVFLDIPVQGTVSAEHIFQVKSPLDGRMEAAQTNAHTWIRAGTLLGSVIPKDFAALLDSNHTTSDEVVRDRWKTIYEPILLKSQSDCYLLSAPTEPKTWVQTGNIVFEMATGLRLEGTFSGARVPDDHSKLALEVWSKSNPGRRWQLAIEQVSDGKVTALLPFDVDLPPGTTWEGRLGVSLKKNVLEVPPTALIHYNGGDYLLMRVSRGISTGSEAEIVDGAYEGQHFLIAPSEQLRDAEKQSTGSVASAM